MIPVNHLLDAFRELSQALRLPVAHDPQQPGILILPVRGLDKRSIQNLVTVPLVVIHPAGRHFIRGWFHFLQARAVKM